MKKTVITLILLLLITGSAFAETAVVFGGKITSIAGGTGTLISAMSANVGGAIMSGTTNFACILKHISGTRNFATSSADTSIFYLDVTSAKKGTQTLEITMTNSTSVDFLSWTKL